MRPVPAALRPWLHVIAGGLVGFLFLAEFALNTFVVVRAALLVGATVGLIGVLRRVRALEMWPLFIAAALVLPVAIDFPIARLPRCEAAAAGVACFAGTRDVVGQLAMEVLTLVVSLVGIGGLFVRDLRGKAQGAAHN
jgi:hypothetical protein